MSNCKNKWTVLCVLAAAWVVFTTIYAIWFVSVPPGTTRAFEVSKFVFLSISAFGVLFSTLLSSFNSLEATQHVEDKIRFDRVENSFAYMQQWDSGHLLQARDLIREIAKQKNALSQEEIGKRFSSNVALERSVVNVFNFVEEIYMSIASGRVDETLLKDAFREVFQTNYECFFLAFKTYSNFSTIHNVNLLHERWK